MKRLLLSLLLLALASPAAGLRPAAATPFPSAYGLTQAVTSATYSRMVDFAMIPGSGDEAVVVRQHAEQVWRVSLSGAFSPTLYGDLTSYVVGGGDEQGLLSVAFSPDFASDGRVYVYYTEDPTQTVLSRFQVSGGAMVTAGPDAETRVLEVPDFASNHNGGKIVFGQDGYLYLSQGDGGGSGDPDENGQDINSLLGKVLRINVTGQATYTNPSDNPFFGAVAGRDEIYAYGFRNPWRMSMDSATGVMWLGDVGQALWEEVEPVAKGGNYGWDCYEGFVVYEPAGCPGSGFTEPRAVYDHGLGCAVTGGYVYHGAAMPELSGWYVYADYCSGRIWAVDAAPGATSAPVLLADTTHTISSFAERPDGELLVLTFENAIYLLHNDGDGDGIGAQLDNCPTVSNPGQLNTDGDAEGNACDADDDNDSLGLTANQTTGSCPTGGVSLPRFRDCIEAYVGTDPLDACANTSGGDDEPTDKSPGDLNDDQRINVVDRARIVLAIKAQASGSYTQRADLNADSTVDVLDRAAIVLYIKTTAGAFCAP